jgi:hypothetical protein
MVRIYNLRTPLYVDEIREEKKSPIRGSAGWEEWAERKG